MPATTADDEYKYHNVNGEVQDEDPGPLTPLTGKCKLCSQLKDDHKFVPGSRRRHLSFVLPMLHSLRTMLRWLN